VSTETRPRPIIVQKYGGSSVADVEKIGKVADRVVAARREGNDVVVVVSAMGKTTDGLLSLAHSVAENDGKRVEPARRELDMLVSTGERVAMSLLSIAVQSRGFSAISFTGSQSGILTNDRHFDARIIEVRPHRIEDELHRGNIVIVAGYQGMSYRREITTLGRGGSDTTAVALAAALEAERCEIYSDVDGVYSADPRVVPDARHLPEMDHAMLQEMAESGAKVVCAQAVEWARRRAITLAARSTFAPGRETLVTSTLSKNAGHFVRAVTSETKLLEVSFERVARSRVFEILRELDLPFKDLSMGLEAGVLMVPLLNHPTAGAVAERLRAHDELLVREDVATVSVVGDGLAGNASALGEFIRIADQAEVTRVIGGPLRLTAVTTPASIASLSRSLHAEFVGAQAERAQSSASAIDR
jgi:aspartate kinase